MDLPPRLVAELAALTEAVADPEVDLQARVHDVAEMVQTAVPSFLGLRITADVEGHPFVLTAVDPATPDIGASLALSFGPSGPRTDKVVVVFYAATPGTFVDLAADAAVVLGRDPGAVVLDAHLDEPPGARLLSGTTGWADIGVLNQAIGLLLGHGHTPTQARAALAQDALASGTSTVDAARALLNTHQAPPPR